MTYSELELVGDSELSDCSDSSAAKSGWSAGKGVVGAAVACFACVGAGFVGGRLTASREPLLSPMPNRGMLQVVANPAREKCSSFSDDCFETGCCDVAGVKCYVTDTPGSAQCMKNCTPSETRACVVPQPQTSSVLVEAVTPGTKMYCFSVYMADTGSLNPAARPDELGLLKAAFGKKIGIFACDEWDIFSDKPTDLAPGVPFTAVVDEDNDFHFAKRKETGTWINTGLHTQVWKAIRSDTSTYKPMDWVVKVDCDAVFVPSRLRTFLAAQGVPATGTPGMYLENCKGVMWGWFGNLEVMSVAAFDTLLPNIEWCKNALDWKTGIDGGKYGPMGEDLFAQRCLDSMGVRRGEAFDIVLDGACEADRPESQKNNKKWVPDCSMKNTAAYHPLMKVPAYLKCHEDTINAFGY